MHEEGIRVDRIQEMLSRLAELSADEIAELEAAILSEFETVEGQDPTPQIVASMTALADASDAVRAELANREAAQQELQTQAAEAAARVRGEDASATAQDTEAEAAITPAPDDKVNEPASPDQPVPDQVNPDQPVPDQVNPDQLPADAVPPLTPEEQKKKKDALPVAAAAQEPAELAVDEASADSTSTTEATVEESASAELSTEVTETPAPAPAAEASAAAEPEGELSAGDAPVTEAAADTASEASISETGRTEAPVTAAATQPEGDLVVEAPADRRPDPRALAAPVAITAGADIPNVTAGSTFASMRDVSDAFAKRVHALKRVNGGDGEQHTVATIAIEYPAARTLGADMESNWSKIQDVVSPLALVASGGYCAPLEVLYDVFSIGTTDRPVRDSLARFGADRGGVRYTTPPVLTSYDNAVGVWTAATDAAPGGNTKTCLTVVCGAELTAVADAVTVCLQFGNLATRAYPEMIARHNELALIQHAREAETNLLTKIKAGGTAVTAARLISATRDFLVQVDKASAAYRYRHRLAANTPLRLLAPDWLRTLIRADLTLQMPGDGVDSTMALADTLIAKFFSVRNINVTWSLESHTGFGAQGAGAILEFPSTAEWDLFAEGTWMYIDGGTLDIGIIRDSTLVGTNDYKTFTETFEGAAKIGPESLHVTSTVEMCGAAAALEDTCLAS